MSDEYQRVACEVCGVIRPQPEMRRTTKIERLHGSSTTYQHKTIGGYTIVPGGNSRAFVTRNTQSYRRDIWLCEEHWLEQKIKESEFYTNIMRVIMFIGGIFALIFIISKF